MHLPERPTCTHTHSLENRNIHAHIYLQCTQSSFLWLCTFQIYLYQHRNKCSIQREDPHLLLALIVAIVFQQLELQTKSYRHLCILIAYHMLRIYFPPPCEHVHNLYIVHQPLFLSNLCHALHFSLFIFIVPPLLETSNPLILYLSPRVSRHSLSLYTSFTFPTLLDHTYPYTCYVLVTILHSQSQHSLV